MTLSGRALSLFAIPPADLAPLQESDARVCDEPHLSRWVAETAQTLAAAVGRPSPPPPLPPRPDGAPGTVAYLPVLAFAQALPTTLSWAQERGIPPTVLAASLSDVGRMLVRNRLWFGEPGVGNELGGWLTRHLVGSILEVGRLQHERTTPGLRTSAWFEEDRAPFSRGDLAVNLHIPESGALIPAAVDDSLRAGKALLRKRFPEERLRVQYCISWLLDPQLGDYLPAASNIMAFQRRFRIGPAADEDGDASVRKFVFGNAQGEVSELPQRTALERAIVAHWRAGRHWRVHLGRVAGHDTRDGQRRISTSSTQALPMPPRNPSTTVPTSQ